MVSPSPGLVVRCAPRGGQGCGGPATSGILLRRDASRASARFANALALFGLCCLPVACTPPGADRELETVEVDAGPTAGLVPDEDPVARGGGAGLAGSLPGDYPPDLPVYVPSSVVDFGEVSRAVRYVELSTTARPESVRSWLSQRWAEAGWRDEGEGNWRKVERRAWLEIGKDEIGETRIRIKYPLE